MKKSRRRAETPEQDEKGGNTRERLLEVAGQVFAEKGFDRATSKEITELAGTNAAAVNYYFEGIEGLYAAVVEEASSMMRTADDLQEAAAGSLDAEAKLEAFIGPFVRVLTSPAASSWRLRILVREFTSPTLADGNAHQVRRLQKVGVLKGIVAELMGLPEGHPAVSRGCISILAPCAMLMTCDRATFKLSFPQVPLSPEEAPALIRHMVRFATAGLAAVAEETTAEVAGARAAGRVDAPKGPRRTRGGVA